MTDARRGADPVGAGPRSARRAVLLLSGPQRGGQPRAAGRGGARGPARRSPTTFEIIAVDDGSRDATPRDRRRLAARQPDVVRVVHHPVNLGLRGGASVGLRGRPLRARRLHRRRPPVPGRGLGRLTERLAAAGRARRRRRLPDQARRPAHPDALRPGLPAGQPDLLRPAASPTSTAPASCSGARRSTGIRVESGGAFFSAELLIKLRPPAGVVEVGVPHYPRTAGSPTGAKPRVVFRAVPRLLVRCGCGCGQPRNGRCDRGEPVLGE